MKFTGRTIMLTCLSVAALSAVSCDKTSVKESSDRSVMILYSAGFNSLHSDLQKNIRELQEGWLPTRNDGEDVVLVVSKPFDASYSSQTSPVLVRMYKKGNKVVADTVKTYDKGRKLVDAESFRSIMQDIKSMYPAKDYGMVFSSHATGWLPAGYYANPGYYEERFHKSGVPARRTVGQEVYIENSVTKSAEMELEEMAAALPYKLDYLLIDACFGGCVELAYAFKDKVDVIGFSQAEVLTYGFDYTSMSETLLRNKVPEKVCQNFINRYKAMSGDWRSATISAVRTSQMDGLADICRSLVSKYRNQLDNLDYSSVQGYFGGSKYWFFDLEDIFLKAGIKEDERAALEKALDACMLFKGTTGQYYSAVDASSHAIDIFSGFSMFLPSVPGDYIKDYYKGLSWNKAVGLVK